MSRAFISSSDHADVAAAVVLAPPLSIIAWIRMTTLGLGYQIFTIGQGGVSTQRFSLGYQAANTIGCNENDGTSSIAQSTTSIADTTKWHLAGGVWTDRTNRAAFLDGAGKGTIAALKAAGVPNFMRASGDLQATPANPFQGLIGLIAVWNVALTDAEMASLTQLYPDQVRPQNLIHLYDFQDQLSPEPDYSVGALPLSISGAALNASFPPIIRKGATPGSQEKRQEKKQKLWLPSQVRQESEEAKAARRIAQGIEPDPAAIEQAASAADVERQVALLNAQINQARAQALRYRERVAAAETASAKRVARARASVASAKAAELSQQIAQVRRAQQQAEEFDIAVIAAMLSAA